MKKTLINTVEWNNSEVELIPKFIADVHLGKLARYLRMLGFDTCYRNVISKKDLLTIALTEKRILLSRDPSFNKLPATRFKQIQDEDPLVQITEVIKTYNFIPYIRPFSRCMICNQELAVTTKDSIKHLVGANTKAYYNEFWQCTSCQRVYWKGSHFKRMEQVIESIT